MIRSPFGDECRRYFKVKGPGDPPPPPPPPTDADAEQAREQARRQVQRRRGRRATILTSADLDQQSTPSQRGSLTTPGSATVLGG